MTDEADVYYSTIPKVYQPRKPHCEQRRDRYEMIRLEKDVHKLISLGRDASKGTSKMRYPSKNIVQDTLNISHGKESYLI